MLTFQEPMYPRKLYAHQILLSGWSQVLSAECGHDNTNEWHKCFSRSAGGQLTYFVDLIACHIIRKDAESRYDENSGVNPTLSCCVCSQSKKPFSLMPSSRLSHSILYIWNLLSSPYSNKQCLHQIAAVESLQCTTKVPWVVFLSLLERLDSRDVWEQWMLTGTALESWHVTAHKHGR